MPPPRVTPEELERLREELERELVRLERSVATSGEAARPVELDQQAVGRLSRMDALQNQHLTRNLKDRSEARYEAVRAALARLDAGTYGICTRCEEAMDPGRLSVFPEAEHCQACAP